MKKKFLPTVSGLKISFFTSAILLLPSIVAAQGISFDIQSPLNGINSAETLITAILGILITIAIPIVVIYIIYAGFLYVTAQGNAEQIKTATRALTYAIIGGILVIGAVAISGIIEGVVTAFRK